MSPILSEQTRNTLRHSLTAVEAQKAAIIEAMSRSLAAAGTAEEAPEHSGEAAAVLVTMLIEQAKLLIEGREPQGLDVQRAEHQLHGIDGRHYSRFGDALVPVLKDTLGPSFAKVVGSTWCDTFWALIRAMHQQEDIVSS